MKTPPWVEENATDKKPGNKYLYGDKMLIGFPKKKYFELYAGMCSSDKIYSVQAKDFPKDVAAVIYYPNYNIEENDGELAKGAKVGTEHVFAVLTDDLVSFLKQRGITSNVMNYQWGFSGETYYKLSNLKEYKNAAFVNPSAFEWVSEDEVEEVDPQAPDDDSPNSDAPTPSEPEKKKSNTKAIIAALIAAISLLN